MRAEPKATLLATAGLVAREVGQDCGVSGVPVHLELKERVSPLRSAPRSEDSQEVSRSRQPGQVVDSAIAAGHAAGSSSTCDGVVRHLHLIVGSVRRLPSQDHFADSDGLLEIDVDPLRIAERARPSRPRIAVDSVSVLQIVD